MEEKNQIKPFFVPSFLGRRRLLIFSLFLPFRRQQARGQSKQQLPFLLLLLPTTAADAVLLAITILLHRRGQQGGLGEGRRTEGQEERRR